jgi:hypothetical protein
MPRHPSGGECEDFVAGVVEVGMHLRQGVFGLVEVFVVERSLGAPVGLQQPLEK